MTSPLDETTNPQGVEEIQPALPVRLSQPTQTRLPWWRLGLPLLFQAALILSVPAQAVYTHLTGKTAILQTVPVDPYDLLRGYYQTLSYEISDWETLSKLPGWSDLVKNSRKTGNPYPIVGTRFYVILEQPVPVQNKMGVPRPWKPVRVSRDRPEQLSDRQVALKGHYTKYGTIEYGLESYYMPEDQRLQVNQDISQAQNMPEQPFVVEIKVDASGRAVPLSLWVRDRNYRF